MRNSPGLPSSAKAKRGPAAAIYKMGEITFADGVLTVKYEATFPKGPGGASFATPLIFSVDKTGVKKVVFVENGAVVGEREVK